MGDTVAEKLSMQYVSKEEQVHRRKLKRKENFATQVKQAVNDMQVSIEYDVRFPNPLGNLTIEYPNTNKSHIVKHTRLKGLCSMSLVGGIQ